MQKKGRPPGKEEVFEYHLHLRLKKYSDADLISFFENIPHGLYVASLKNALRAGGIEKNTEISELVEDDSFADDLQSLTF